MQSIDYWTIFSLNFLKNQDWKQYWNLGMFLVLLESPHQVQFNNVLIVCQLKNLRCQEYFKNDPLVETCFMLFTNIVGHSTWKHCWCREYLANDDTIERCFQPYTNIVNKSTQLVIAIILFKFLKNPVET